MISGEFDYNWCPRLFCMHQNKKINHALITNMYIKLIGGDEDISCPEGEKMDSKILHYII